MTAVTVQARRTRPTHLARVPMPRLAAEVALAGGIAGFVWALVPHDGPAWWLGTALLAVATASLIGTGTTRPAQAAGWGALALCAATGIGFAIFRLYGMTAPVTTLDAFAVAGFAGLAGALGAGAVSWLSRINARRGQAKA